MQITHNDQLYLVTNIQRQHSSEYQYTCTAFLHGLPIKRADILDKLARIALEREEENENSR